MRGRLCYDSIYSNNKEPETTYDLTFRITSKAMRELILTHSKAAHVGHIASCLSIVDILVSLYTKIFDRNSAKEITDQFILSKGHAALALYSALYLEGSLTEEEMKTYCNGMTLPLN